MNEWITHLGECLAHLKTLPEDSFDAIVTDPPAGIAFMGKEWDEDRGGRAEWVAWMEDIARECLRVLKPGGHALVWSLPRTSHWTGWAWESAGWFPRDMILHVHGQGFPKSMDVSKAIDRAAGAEREVVGVDENRAARAPKHSHNQFNSIKPSNRGYNTREFAENAGRITAPATPGAQQWEGWGTALKPSVEGWWMFRKPLVGTVAENIQEYGTGAINIDGCRIGTREDIPVVRATRRTDYPEGWGRSRGGSAGDAVTWDPKDGRWPANFVLSHNENCALVGTRRVRANSEGSGKLWSHYRDQTEDRAQAKKSRIGDEDGMEVVETWACTDGCPVKMLDEQSGELTSGNLSPGHKRAGGAGNAFSSKEGVIQKSYGGDSGGASRFFYTAKSSRHEKSSFGRVENRHPTVKPVALMRYLCRLITPPGGIVLDPFMGSGTTGVAARQEGFPFYGIEQDQDSFDTSNVRLEHALDPPPPEEPRTILPEETVDSIEDLLFR